MPNRTSRWDIFTKIKTALDVRIDEGLVIIARSELRGNDEEKIERLYSALELGADAFWAGGFSPEQVKKVCHQFQKPAVAVLPKTMSAEQFGALGPRLAVVPGALAVAGIMAQRALLEDMKTSGSWSAWLERQSGFKLANDYYNGQGLARR
jgi:2-methylisocitrate lyase-like PEP mutase family enzyme